MSEVKERQDSKQIINLIDEVSKLPNNKALLAIAKYAAIRITDKTEVAEICPVFKIAGQVIGTKSNIIAISGGSKSGKSTVVNTLIAGAINSRFEPIIDACEFIEIAENSSRKAVVHFDTEQAKHRHKKNLKKVCYRAGGSDETPENLYSYNLREISIEDAQIAIPEILQGAAVECGGVHSVFIDGIADLISDVNSIDQSTTIVKFIAELSIKYDCLIVVIVHTNPNSEKERGHLGSEIQRKSESVLRVRMENDLTLLEPVLLREAGKANVPTLLFKYDEAKGYAVPYGVYEKVAKQSTAERLGAITIDEVKKVFNDVSAYKYSQAIAQVQEKLSLAQNKAKDRFKMWCMDEFVIKDSKGIYTLNPQYKAA